MNIKQMITLARPYQWYKNVVIFIAIFLGGNILNFKDDLLVFAGFIALSLVSSFNYIVNDLIDSEKDRNHPEKRKRPIASGEVKKHEAIIFATILIIIGLTISLLLSINFGMSVLVLAILGILYNLGLKKEAYLDVIIVGCNFVIRAVSGALIIGVMISPWLIVCTFFAAIFMVLGKRKGDLLYLGEKAKLHKDVFKKYNDKILDMLISIVMGVLIISYTLYTFLKGKPMLVVTLPFATYFLMRYLHLIQHGSKVARHPHLLITDKRMVTCAAIWVGLFLGVFYFI